MKNIPFYYKSTGRGYAEANTDIYFKIPPAVYRVIRDQLKHTIQLRTPTWNVFQQIKQDRKCGFHRRKSVVSKNS